MSAPYVYYISFDCTGEICTVAESREDLTVVPIGGEIKTVTTFLPEPLEGFERPSYAALTETMLQASIELEDLAAQATDDATTERLSNLSASIDTLLRQMGYCPYTVRIEDELDALHKKLRQSNLTLNIADPVKNLKTQLESYVQLRLAEDRKMRR